MINVYLLITELQLLINGQRRWPKVSFINTVGQMNVGGIRVQNHGYGSVQLRSNPRRDRYIPSLTSGQLSWVDISTVYIIISAYQIKEKNEWVFHQRNMSELLFTGARSIIQTICHVMTASEILAHNTEFRNIPKMWTITKAVVMFSCFYFTNCIHRILNI